VVAFLILIAPFVYLLVFSGSLLNLLWMLFFTPFYGLAIMILVYPVWMMLYYAASFVSLFVLRFFLRKSNRRVSVSRKSVSNVST
jgi:hypothetical protein